MSDVLQRVAWQLGQVLRPAHFRALEGSLAEEAAVRARAVGLPADGVLRLKWTEDLPANGVVALTELSWLAPDGQLIVLDRNARLDGTLALKSAKTPRVEVFLHRLDEPSVARDTGTEHGPRDGVDRTHIRLKLSSERTIPGSSLACLRLGAFRRVAEHWELERESIPAILSVINTPFLGSALADLRTEIDRADTALREGDLSPELRGDERFVRMRARFALRHARDLLTDLLTGAVDLHPYVVFAALRQLSRELEAMGNLPVPADYPFAYRHENPGACFGAALRLLVAQLTTPLPTTNLYRFDRAATEKGSVFELRKLPPAAFQPDVETYVLVHRNDREGELSLERASLTSPSLLRATVEHRRTSLPLERLRDDVLTRRFGDWIRVYRVRRDVPHAHEAWSAVSSERALSLVDHEIEPGTSLFLYWRQRDAAR